MDKMEFNNMELYASSVWLHFHYAQLLFLLYLTIYCSCFRLDTALTWVAGFILVVL